VNEVLKPCTPGRLNGKLRKEIVMAKRDVSLLWEFVKHREWIGAADCLVHILHAPKFIRNPVCDAWDNYLGVNDDDELA
jgi:hypothetical protein